MSAEPSQTPSVLGDLPPAQVIVRLAIPATLALLAKAIYNLVDTAYIGMLHSDIALTAVGVTVPLLLIMVSIENIFAAGAAVLAGRQMGAKDESGASRTVTTIVFLSVGIGVVLCVGGIVFIEPLMRTFGASDTSLPLAKDYAFWLSSPLIQLFNRNPVIVEYGKWLLISQVALYPAFGLCYMMTITCQTIGASRYGLFLSVIRQGLFYLPFILVLPRLFAVQGIYAAQPAADVLTVLVCLFSIKPMQDIASRNLHR